MTEKKGFSFGLGKMKELAAAFQKAQQIQEEAKKLQEELETMQLVAQSNDGTVVVTITGNQEPLRVEIKPEAMQYGAEKLSEVVTEAVRNAYQLSTQTMREKMENLTSSINLPGVWEKPMTIIGCVWSATVSFIPLYGPILTNSRQGYTMADFHFHPPFPLLHPLFLFFVFVFHFSTPKPYILQFTGH